MKELLAERLLASVMNWQPEDLARERPILQAMAAYKYDEYQQFSRDCGLSKASPYGSTV